MDPHFSIQDVGLGKGKYYALNFPLRDGISDENYKTVFEPVSLDVVIPPPNISCPWRR
jgi:acetoin utilization deacetylase AcuC-like enzyme